MIYTMRPALARVLMALSLIATMLFGAAAVRPVAASTSDQVFASPQALLLSYYSDINLRAYAQAYSDWLAPTQSYADFASGYLTTERVLPYFGDWQPAPATGPVNELGRVPAVLFGYHTDGTQAAYNGCFFIGQNASGWKIVNANFKPLVTPNYFPNAAVLNAALSVNCYAPTVAVPFAAADLIASAPDRGQAALVNYYNLVNKRDYLNAYTQWLQPIPGQKPNGAPAQDYRLPYADFVAGYSDTVYAYAYLGAYNESGAFAGHGYIDGTIPAVLVGQHTDGSVTSYYGCYVLGILQNGSLGIVSGKFLPIQTPYVLSGKTISSYLTLDCTTLQLQF